MPEFYSKGVKFHYEVLGQDQGPVFVWGHGWGQSHKSFLALVESLKSQGRHILIDFPGFGESSIPHDVWGSQDYADAVADWLKTQSFDPVIWVGHSFGCRVGLQMGINHPHLVRGLCLIGGAGLRRRRTLWQNIRLYSKIYTFKFLKHFIPPGVNRDWLYSKFGSPDYRNAGPIRPIMVKVNSEDLTDLVSDIACPVCLIYGKNDTETPPEIGERLSKLIPNAELFLLDGQDHYTVLSTGRHQVAKIIKDMVQKIKS